MTIKNMKKVNRNKIVVAYCRSATIDQSGCRNTLKQQQEKCLQEAKSDGFRRVKVITEVANGSSLKRRGIQTLIKLVKENRVSSVYAVDIERLSRNTTDYFTLKRLFDRHGVELKIIDSPSATQKFIEVAMASLSEYQRDIQSEKIKMGIKRKKLLKAIN